MKQSKIKPSIYNLTKKELQEFLVSHNLKKYVCDQLWDWIYVKKIENFSEISNIKKDVINLLEDNFSLNELSLRVARTSEDLTTKFLFKLSDDQLIETVLMKFDYGYSVCISSQIGCNMGCSFCASGLIKKIRDLTVGELVNQITYVNQYTQKNFNEKISHIVVMGIGEPFDNFDNLLKFLEIVKDQKGLGIGARRITVSTCGLVKKIDQWARLEDQVNLAVSLHAPNDSIRSDLMPINRAFNIKRLMESIDAYIALTNRRVTIEYILIKGVNDQKEHAIELANLLKGKLCYVNLIPYNPVAENEFERSENVKNFYSILKEHNILSTVRQEKGSNINAACGQLRNNNL